MKTITIISTLTFLMLNTSFASNNKERIKFITGSIGANYFASKYIQINEMMTEIEKRQNFKELELVKAQIKEIGKIKPYQFSDIPLELKARLQVLSEIQNLPTYSAEEIALKKALLNRLKIIIPFSLFFVLATDGFYHLFILEE